jgi:hypothetical protein
LLSSADNALSSPIPPLHSWCLIRRAAENCRDGRVRPSRVLAHGRCDGNAFCDDEGYWVYSHGDGSRVQARSRLMSCRLMKSRRGIFFAADARHGGEEVVSRLRMRQKSMGCSDRVVMVVGTRATIFVNHSRHASSSKVAASREDYDRYSSGNVFNSSCTRRVVLVGSNNRLSIYNDSRELPMHGLRYAGVRQSGSRILSKGVKGQGVWTPPNTCQTLAAHNCKSPSLDMLKL